MRWPFRRADDVSYILHLEEEIRWLRQVAHPMVDPSPALKPPRVPKEQPPQSLVELCSRFEAHGATLLADCRAEHERNGTPYAALEDRIRAHLEQQVSGTWQDPS
jgi:hypothetical protein